MLENNSLDITTAVQEQSSYIKVIGVGGAGTNAVSHMYRQGIVGVDFIVCNTDKQNLENSPVPTRIQIGADLELGLGAGNNPAVGQKAAIESSDTIKAVLDHNIRMLFIAAGMGGGTGTGASPVIAKIAKEIEVDEGRSEVLIVAVVTTPYAWEGRKRRLNAAEGIKNLKEVVDSMIVVNIDKLQKRGNMAVHSAFAMVDDILLTAVKGISEVMTANAYIHVDFRDVQSVMQHSGVALMGSGIGEGEDRAYKAIVAASESDLLNDDNFNEAKNVLLYISYSSKEEYQLQTDELATITSYVQEITNIDVDMIWGCGTDDSLDGKLCITLVATGFASKDIYFPGVINPVTPAEKPVSQPNQPKILPLEAENKAEETKLTENLAASDVVEPVIVRENLSEKQVEETKHSENNFHNTPKLDGFELIDKAKESENSSAAEKSEPEKTVLTLDGENPISYNRNIDGFNERDFEKDAFQSGNVSSSTSQTHQLLEEKEDIMEQIKEMERRKEKMPSPIDELPDVQDFSEKKDLKEEEPIPSIFDITAETISSDKANRMASLHATSSSLEEKRNRIQKLHDFLATGGVSDVEKMKPYKADFAEKLSELSIPTTYYSVNSDGNIIVSENKTINAGED